MKITADTNILLRAVLDDEPSQSLSARQALEEAEGIAITLATFCEIVWVLRKNDRRSPEEAASLVRLLLAIPNVFVDQAAVEAGLSVLVAGGDFADGVIAYDGTRLGGDVFVTFDRKAAALLKTAGLNSLLLPTNAG